VLKQIEAFFVNYQKVREVKVKIIGRSGPRKAREILRSWAAKTRSIMIQYESHLG